MRRISPRVALTLVLLAAACHREAGAPRAPHDAGAVAPRVVVVGGGLSGLVTAYELGKRGIPTEVLEASDAWGGRVATAYYGGGLYAEYGMQEMWADNPLLRIARELGVPLDEKAEQPFSSVVIDGKLIPYVQPTTEAYFASFLSPSERGALTSWMASAQALRTGAVAARAETPEMEHLQKISFADWVETFRLPKRVSEWIRLTLECELGTDWRSFSGLSGLLEFGFFLGPGELNYHVRGGNSGLVAALVNAVRGPKLLSATVTGVDRWWGADGRPRARVSFMRNQHLETVEAERVILAVPFTRVHQIRIDPPLSHEKWRAINSLERGQYTVVHLLMDKDARKLWMVGNESPFPVLTDGDLGVVYGVVYPSPPSQPLEVFALLVHGDAAAAYHMVPREARLHHVLFALDKLWPGLSAHVHGSNVFTYHPAAIPAWPPGRSPLDADGRGLSEPELGLTLVGDYTRSAHSNGAVESALAAAARVSDELTSASALARSPSGPHPADHPAP